MFDKVLMKSTETFQQLPDFNSFNRVFSVIYDKHNKNRQ